MSRPTDVTVTCPCCGASRSVTARKAKTLSRLPSPVHEQALHKLAGGISKYGSQP
jgi:biotin synthase-related radical SAM superfamily protein